MVEENTLQFGIREEDVGSRERRGKCGSPEFIIHASRTTGIASP
jgi:hypothetical protein